MNSRSILSFSIFPVLLVVVLDQAFKSYARGHSEVYYNLGFIFGTLSDAPPIARIVCVSTLFVFLLLAGILSQLFFIQKNKLITFSLGLFLGGILSNAIDRLYTGAVIDHIILPGLPNLAWNLADLFQWIGLIIFLSLIWKHRNTLWNEQDNLRKKLLINSSFQYGFIATVMLFVGFIWLVLILFSYTYFKFITEMTDNAPFFITSFCLLMVFELCALLFSLWWSHKFAGPLYAFERHIDALLNENEVSPLSLRKGDKMKVLESLANKIQTYIKR